MSTESAIRRLMAYENKMDLNPPLSGWNTLITVPAPYAELLGFFNGGEIFMPGTVIYSLEESEAENAASVKNSYGIPHSLFIIGRTNYDAPVCMEKSAPYRIILWDPDVCEQEAEWDSISDFFEEEISDYLRYLSEK